MYKNFSCVFCLGALLLLAACDGGNEKSTDETQKDTTESQEMLPTQKDGIKPITEISSEDQAGGAESKAKEDDIYADINRPIDLKTPSSTNDDNIEIVDQINSEGEAIKENIVAASPQNEEPVVNTESINDASVNPTSELNTEKEVQEESPKIEDTQPIDTVNNEESPKIEDIQPADTVNNEENPKVENAQPTDTPNNAESSVVEEISTVPVSGENTENSDKIPEVSIESDVPVIPEEPIEEKSFFSWLTAFSIFSSPNKNISSKASDIIFSFIININFNL